MLLALGMACSSIVRKSSGIQLIPESLSAHGRYSDLPPSFLKEGEGAAPFRPSEGRPFFWNSKEGEGAYKGQYPQDSLQR
jgi:hypothetical protein